MAETDAGGFYIGAGVGQFNVEIDDFEDLTDQDFDSDDTSLKLFGGWRFSPFFGAELAYIDFGGPEDTINAGAPRNSRWRSRGSRPTCRHLPLGIFELFAKVGYYFYDVDIRRGRRGVRATQR